MTFFSMFFSGIQSDVGLSHLHQKTFLFIVWTLAAATATNSWVSKFAQLHERLNKFPPLKTKKSKEAFLDVVKMQKADFIWRQKVVKNWHAKFWGKIFFPKILINFLCQSCWWSSAQKIRKMFKGPSVVCIINPYGMNYVI